MGVWDHAHWMRNEKIKNLKKILPRGPPKLFSGSEEQRDCCTISSYSNLKSKGDDVIPIDSHVTSEEERRKKKTISYKLAYVCVCACAYVCVCVCACVWCVWCRLVKALFLTRVSQKTTRFSDHFESDGSWLPTMVENFINFFGIFWFQEIVGNSH